MQNVKKKQPVCMTKEDFLDLLDSIHSEKNESPPCVQGSLIAFLEAYRDGDISTYSENRGRPGVNRGMVKRIKQNFHLPALLAFPVAKVDGNWTIVDANTRTTALAEMFEAGLISDEILQKNVNFLVCHEEDFMALYVHLNDSIRHSKKAQITNSDLLGGALLNHLESFTKNRVPNNLVSNALDLLVALEVQREQNNILQPKALTSARGKFEKVQNTLAKDKLLEVSLKSTKKAAKAIDYYFTLSEKLPAYAKKAEVRKEFRTLANSAGFFILITLDFLDHHRFTDYSPEEVAFVIDKNRSLRKKLTEAVSQLGRRNKDINGKFLEIATELQEKLQQKHNLKMVK